MKVKKGTINVDGHELKQYFLEDQADVKAYFKRFPFMNIKSLKEAFQKTVDEGVVVITDTKTNIAGFFSWRTEGKENWNRVTELEMV